MPRDRARDGLVPAPDDEIDLGVGAQRPHGGDRVERHQQVADALEAQQQDALWLAAPAPPHRRSGQADGRQRRSARPTAARSRWS